jgi:NHL repeat
MFRLNLSRPAIAVLALSLGCALVSPASAQVYTYQQTLGTTGVAGSDNKHFNNPSSGVVDSINGHYFVADVLNQRVQAFDTNSLTVVATLGVTGATGTDNDHFNEPSDVGFDPGSNRIFVADGGNQRIQVFDAKSFAYVATIGVTGIAGSDNGHFANPGSSRVNTRAGQVLIADFSNDRVQIFDAKTLAYIATLGTSGVPGSDNAHLSEPVVADVNAATNQIMVADSENDRVQFFDAGSFAYVSTLGGPGPNHSDNSHFEATLGVSYDATATLFLIADGGSNDRVQVYDALTNGYVMTLGTTGVSGQANTQFLGPGAMAVDPAHARLFVSDVLNERVQVFSIAPTAAHASVLPGSRSVQLGTPATIFATMINSGSSSLESCQIALPVTAPAGLTLSYQTTDPATNTLTGTANAPATIAAGGLQSFVVSFSGSSAFDAPGLPLDFDCAGAAPAAVITGVDTVDLAMSSTPIADIIALAATPTNNGIVQLQQGSSGAFAVASTNLGVTAAIAVSADTGGATLPVTATLCQSNPANGECLAAPAASVSLTYAGGTAPTFSIFITATGAIPFDPANSRIFVRFKDSAGELHGSTSVAVEAG